jgi:thiol-disulfide isomerase/thioredoxin
MRFFFAATLTLSLAYGQSLPDGDTVMKQVADAAKRHHSLQFVAESSIDTGQGKMTSEMSTTSVNPGKTRIESKAMGTTTLIVSNPEFTTMYMSMNKQFIRIPAALGPMGMISAMGIKLPDMASIQQTSKTLREETIDIDGVKRDCWVVENRIGDITMPIPGNDKMQIKMTGAVMTMWVDKKLSIDVKSSISMKMEMPNMPAMVMHQTMLKKNIKIDEPIDDSIFAFTPPADAIEVKELSFATAALPKADLTGKDAPAFSVQGIDGKTYTSATLRGKTVLLDFWATWCVPCRVSMPAVEKLHKDYKERGLIVLGVNVAEDLALVDEFVKKTPFAYPVVLSGESQILETYKVTAYPTFVLIGPDGKVVAHEIGFGGPEMLQKMIGKSTLSTQEAAKKP